jgi:hypothetical protein
MQQLSLFQVCLFQGIPIGAALNHQKFSRDSRTPSFQKTRSSDPTQDPPNIPNLYLNDSSN